MPDGSVRHDTGGVHPDRPDHAAVRGCVQGAGQAGAKQDVGIEGFFAPTPQRHGRRRRSPPISPAGERPGARRSSSTPGRSNPNGVAAVGVLAATSRKLNQDRCGEPARSARRRRCPTASRSRFDGWKPWASMQVSHDPAQGYLLVAAVAMVIGLIGSLGVRRRRLWLRITPGRRGADDGVAYRCRRSGGLARSDSGNFTTEFAGAARTAGSVPARRSRPSRSSRSAREGSERGGHQRLWPTCPTGCSPRRSRPTPWRWSCYTAEYAFGRRGRVRPRPAVEPARVLVGAGGRRRVSPPVATSGRCRRRVARRPTGSAAARRRRSPSSARCCTLVSIAAARHRGRPRCRGATCTSSRRWSG